MLKVSQYLPALTKMIHNKVHVSLSPIILVFLKNKINSTEKVNNFLKFPVLYFRVLVATIRKYSYSALMFDPTLY